MDKGSKRTIHRRWMLSAALCVGIHLLLKTVTVSAEEDHLVGIKVKDEAAVPAMNPVVLHNDLSALVGDQMCNLIKVQYYLTQTEKNGGDDPRGGLAGHFVCYKAKCTTKVNNVSQPSLNSQFGTHALQDKTIQLVCLPVN